MHVVLAGGGTAGHVEPALAIADALRRRDADVGITMLGTARGLENRLVPARGYDLALIPPDLPWGKLSALAGDAAFQYIRAATELAVAGKVAAICTAPMNKEALHAGGTI